MKISRILSLPLFVLMLIVAACGSPSGEEQAGEGTATEEEGPAVITDLAGVSSYYECPMKCDGKQYDGPGACPDCGMPLALVEEDGENGDAGNQEEHDHEGHDHEGHSHEDAPADGGDGDDQTGAEG